MYNKTDYNSGLVRSPNSYGYTSDTFYESNNLFPVDIFENENEYTLIADLPGFKKENVHITYGKDHLHMHAYKEILVDKLGTSILNERINRSFTRTFTLLGVDENKISTSFHEGVLQMVLKKNFVYDPSIKQITIN